MNLHGIVSGAISAVNPQVPATLKASTGSVVGPNGKPVPQYASDVTISAQVQAMTYRDIEQVDGLNLNGTRRSIYANGKIDGLVRSQNKGGDLIVLTDGPNAGTWLVAMVLEQWPDWVKVAVTLQNP